MITIIMNHSILSNEDLATMTAEAIETNEMLGGLWGIKVDQYAMFDSSDMFRDSTGCNAIINASCPKVASTQPGWFPTDAELEEEARLMAPNVSVNLTLPQGHPERQTPLEG
jgi:hypothetical protein